MYAVQDGIAIVFKIINFGCVLFLARYLYRTYLVDRVKSHIIDQDQKLMDLIKHNEELIAQQYSVKTTLKNKRLEHEYLKSKLMEWKRATVQQKQQCEQESAYCAAALQQRYSEQAKSRTAQHLMEAMVPAVFEEVVANLTERHSTGDKVDQVLEHIFATMDT
jgi:hypothetical protein